MAGDRWAASMEGREEERGTTLWFVAAAAACDVLIVLGIVGLRLNYHIYVLAPGFSFVQRKIGAGL